MSDPSKQNPIPLYEEALQYGRYFLKQEPSATAQSLYVKAIQQSQTLHSARDARLLTLSHSYPSLLGLLDSGLVLTDRHAELRRRLYIMFAILESLPEYADYFLPRQRSVLYLPFFVFVGVRAVIKSLLGMALVKAVR